MNYDAKIDAAGGEEDASFNPLVAGDEEDRASGRRMWIIAAVAVVLMVGLWFALHRGGGEKIDNAKSEAPVVTVIAPGRTTIAGRVTATGTLAARREMPVGSVGEGGQVVEVRVEPGQWVKQGQVLAVIDRSVQTQQELGLAASIRVAEADARLAQANLERAQKLVGRGFISKADLDRLTATRDMANARVAVARAQLGEMQARVRRLNIVAPADGLLLEREVEPGQVVAGGGNTPLFRIAKGGEMELLAKLTEEDLAAIAVGVSAKVTPVGSNKSFIGQDRQISPVIDPQTRQGTARIALAYQPELRPGGFANVEIAGGTIVAPMLPESAVLSDAKGSYVFVIDQNNKVVRRDVKTGSLTDRGIAVVSGLTGNERIVQRAGAFLSAGETVRPKLAPPPKG
jgi:RND family efflux transporter MFP subunit